MDDKGEHIGRDYINYWAGAKQAIAGRAPAVYDLTGFWDYEKSLVGDISEAKMYSYPPVLLLLTLPLGLLPFLPGYFLWSILGVAAGTLLLRAQTGWKWPLALTAAFAAPASAWNLIAGQNGFFTAVFLGGGLLMMGRHRPILGGILLGFLCYKPQLGLLLPVALLAGREWKAFFAASVTVVSVVALSALVFGINAWLGFIHQAHTQSIMLDMSHWPLRMPTAYAALRVLHAPGVLAYAAQIISTICAAALVAKIWHSKTSYAVKSAALCMAAFLATPYAWDYDMIVLTCAMIWMIMEAQRTEFLPWEKFTWMLVLLLPTPLMAAAQFLGFQPGPFVLWAALLLIFRRSRRLSP